MDTDELDQWLEADDSGGMGTPRADGWATPSPDRAPPTRGRSRWRWLALAGVVLWVGVMAVALTGGDDSAPQAPAPTSASDLMVLPGLPGGDIADEGSGEAQSEVLPSADPDMPATPSGNPPPDDQAADIAATTATATATAPVVGEDVGLLHGAAVAALRAVLTTSTDEQVSYLELATPVAVTPLPEGAAIVVLDAVWLAGTQGALSEVHQGRWAVPLAADATLLGTPWPAGAATTGTAVPEEPPVGAVQLPEVGAAMEAAGWTDVQAVAAQDHPFIPDVLVALVQGIPPGGHAGGGVVVWLQDTGDGLALLGADR